MKKILSIFALLLMAVTGAMAQTETLLTTITATAKEQASYSTANVATVSFSYTTGGSSAYLANWGWWGYGWTATVTPAEGYTITKCIFYDDADRTATDSEAPFVVETTEEDKTPRINGTPIDGGNYQSKGLKKIEVYGYVTPTATQYSVTLAEGTDDAGNWTISPATAEEGQTVTITYNGTKKVKSVKAVKKASGTPLDNATTAWTAGTFAVPAGGLTYSDAITVSGDVTLVLTDGETLTLNKGISIAAGATLTIQGNGTMNVNGSDNSTASTVAGTGTLLLTSGTLSAKGGNGAGVGERSMDTDNRAYAGGNAINGNVTVSGGTLTAIGGNGGGVGRSSYDSYGAVGGVAISGSVTVTGGTVTATGGNGGDIGARSLGSYGGAGGAAIGGDATISGGTWTASNGTHGVNDYGQGSDGGKAVAGTVTDNR